MLKTLVFFFFSFEGEILSNPFVITCYNCLVFSHPLQILTRVIACKLTAWNASKEVTHFISNICEEKSIKCVNVEAVVGDKNRFFLGGGGVRFELAKFPTTVAWISHFG